MKDVERRAAEARRLLDEPLLKEAFAYLEANAFEELLAAGDDRARLELVERVKAIRGVQQYLQTVIASGGQRHPVPIV